jgi:hypothetical protein
MSGLECYECGKWFGHCQCTRESKQRETARLEKAAMDAVTSFCLRTDADLTNLKRVVDLYHFQQQGISQALDDLEREDQEQS